MRAALKVHAQIFAKVSFYVIAALVTLNITYQYTQKTNTSDTGMDGVRPPSHYLARRRTEASSLFVKISRPETTIDAINSLYARYGPELAILHSKMSSWCERENSCKFCDREAEMLYMQIREWKPSRVFEMAPNRGYSTHFILTALKANGRGHLDSFDIHSAADRAVEDTELRAHWSFHLKNVTEYAESQPQMMNKYDFIFIDALHTIEFSDWYTKTLLSHQVQFKTPVVIHDIVANNGYSGRESMAVFAFLAMRQDVGYLFTLNTASGIPTHFTRIQSKDIHTTYEAIRAKHKCGGNHKNFTCFGLDPSIFFLKMPYALH